jgi:hypothetical protein
MFNLASVISRRAILSIVSVGVIVVAVAGYFAFQPKAEIPAYNVDTANVAIHGYDTVAYFTEGKATKGKSEFEHEWEDARWHFASATNRDLFATNPDRYAPKFGGYCAAGVALGEYADADPEAFSIVDGKLYMISTKDNHEYWKKSKEGHIGFAEYNWERNKDQFRDNL